MSNINRGRVGMLWREGSEGHSHIEECGRELLAREGALFGYFLRGQSYIGYIVIRYTSPGPVWTCL